MKNLLKRADAIMNGRAEEKEREYGPFVESIRRAATIANEMCDEVYITPEVMMKCLIGLKLGRLRYNLKEDTILDALSYIDGLYKVNQAELEDETLPFLEN